MQIKISPFGDVEVNDVEVADLPRVEAFIGHVREMATQALIEYEASAVANDFPTTPTEEEDDE